MSVRVVARVRPLLKSEVERDQIVGIQTGSDNKPSIVKIPNPKNQSEEYTFQFNSVYGQEATQQQIFEAEVTPTVKHLFQGYDVTIFAYGSTGTGKTHTMRGGKSLADRGMIPRLLSSIYRKSRAIEKSSENSTRIDVAMSYYEIYNDRVYDLFEAPEKRTATGLPIREAEGGKTVVVGLTEMPCNNLKDFEILYDKANANRSVGATKLNAHSSRSHAILCVKVTISTPTETRVSTASAIDLAGSEDNRRTGNVKERMVESASINKSLFVLAQCVEAISKKQQRIPYRESKMTRILSLGQNNGFTVMILNLAPVKAFHLDTLSSLNFANRTKKIEVREIENEPIFKGPPKSTTATTNTNAQRRPLQQLTNNISVNLTATRDPKTGKPGKEFAVYSDKSKPNSTALSRNSVVHKSSPLKRNADASLLSTRPSKQFRPAVTTTSSSLHRRLPSSLANLPPSKRDLENLIEQKVSQILAEKALSAPAPAPSVSNHPAISAEVQARLDNIEKRLEGQEGERAEGLSYLFMAKQHQARGEDFSALKMYELARPFFSGNEKLDAKIARLKKRLEDRKRKEKEREPGLGHEHEHEYELEPIEQVPESSTSRPLQRKLGQGATKKSRRAIAYQDEEDEEEDASYINEDADDSYHMDRPDDDDANDNSDEVYSDDDDDDNFYRQRKHNKSKSKPKPKPKSKSAYQPIAHDYVHTNLGEQQQQQPPSPRTTHILNLLNTRNPSQIQKLNGMGVKKAELIAHFLNQRCQRPFQPQQESGDEHEDIDQGLRNWNDVLRLDIRGIGVKSWEGVRDGLVI